MDSLAGRFRHGKTEAVAHEDNGRLRLPPPASLYMSPPEEEGVHTFSEDASPAPTKQDWSTQLAPIRLGPSPPVSPSTSPLPRLPALNTEMSQHADPPLFPRTRADSEASATAPLFGRHASEALGTLRQDSLSPEEKRISKKAVNETSIFSTFKTNDDLSEYRRSNLEELERIGGFGKPCEPRMTPLLNKMMHDYDMGVKRSLHHRTGAGVTKTRKPVITRSPAQRVIKPVRTPATVTVTPTAPRRRAPAAPRATPAPRDRQTASLEPSTSQPRKRAPPTKQPPPKDTDALWSSIPNLCPPTSTLPSTGFKIQWRGSAAPLTNDPDLQHLHPAEAEAAAELRLSGKQYLANKRRIFVRRVECLREGRSWTKTMAQQSCNVDVNKVSKLFEGFERVGWFEVGWFQQYL